MFRTILALLAAALSLAATAAEAKWRATETQHFVIYSRSSPEYVQELAERLERFDKLMRMATGFAGDIEPVKVRIYEVDERSDVDRALGLHNSGVAGFYDSNFLGPFLVTPRRTNADDKYFTRELVLQHEYAHHFMLQYFPAVYPDWYTEGFAELIGSSQLLKDGRIGYGMPARHRGGEIAANWVPLQELLTREKGNPDLDTYGQGWALTHYFTFDPQRSKQLRAYLAALTAGRSMMEAAAVFGDLNDLNRDARLYVVRGRFDYKAVPVEIRIPVIQRSRALSAAEAALIPEVIAFRDDDLASYKSNSKRERERTLRESNLRRVREKASQYPNDAFALTMLGKAEYISGNFAAAEAAVDRLLAIDPNNIEGLVQKSLQLSRRAASLSGGARAAAIEQARARASKANRLNVEHPQPLIAFYESYHLTGEQPPELALDGLRKAVSLLPRDTSTRRLLINALEAKGRFAEAIAWLLPLASAPHESPLRDSAREQLERLRAKLAGGGAKARLSQISS